MIKVVGKGRISNSEIFGGAVLQIIGWILCLLLLGKSFEFFTSKNYKNEENDTTIGAGIGGLVTALGSVVFAWMLFNQGAALSSSLGGSTASVPDYIDTSALDAVDTTNVDAATKAASDRADAALKNADEALKRFDEATGR